MTRAVFTAQDALIMAGTILGVILNAVLLTQTLQTAHRHQQAAGVMQQQPT